MPLLHCTKCCSVHPILRVANNFCFLKGQMPDRVSKLVGQTTLIGIHYFDS